MTDWTHVYEGAACRDHPELDWFPDRRAGGQTIAALREVCNSCPVQAECLEMAMTERLYHGVWGGMSERQRSRLRTARYQAAREAVSA